MDEHTTNTLPVSEELRDACAPMTENVKWIKALAIFHMSIAAFMSLTIVGLVVSWAFAWVGWTTWKSARSFERAAADTEHFDAHVQEGMEQMALHFLIQVGILGVFLLLMLLLGVGWLFHPLPGQLLQH